MRRTTSFLVVIFSLSIFVGLWHVNGADARSLSVLTSQHKFSPDTDAEPNDSEVESAISTDQAGVLIISQGDQLIKCRPAEYLPPVVPASKLAKRLSARSAIVLDAASGQALFGKSPDQPGQPASTIKILTGLISLDSLQANEPVSVSRRASRMPRSKVYLRHGKTYPANDLINAVLMASANDASVALGEKIAGSESTFAKLMTAKAQSFGAMNTICRTASGLTYRGQHSTARDLAIIFNKAMENQQFAMKMSRTKVKTRDGKVLRSHNRALWQIDGAVGGKTGYTSLARQTYVGKFSRDNHEIVVAFLGSERMWDDVKELVEYGFKKKAIVDRQSLASQDTTDSRSYAEQIVTLDHSSGQGDVPLLLSELSKGPRL